MPSSLSNSYNWRLFGNRVFMRLYPSIPKEAKPRVNLNEIRYVPIRPNVNIDPEPIRMSFYVILENN